jgi:hypothetical protein
MNKFTKKVAEVQYRCSGNYKTNMVMLIPEGKKFKVGDDIEVNQFGISNEEWYNNLLPNKFDPQLDHNLVEILAIRKRRDDDLPVNAE